MRTCAFYAYLLMLLLSLAIREVSLLVSLLLFSSTNVTLAVLIISVVLVYFCTHEWGEWQRVVKGVVMKVCIVCSFKV